MNDHTKTGWLHGWKSIAWYLGVHVDTAKKYHRNFKMPVHKMPGQASASVMALPAQIDMWILSYNQQRTNFIEKVKKKTDRSISLKRI